MIETHWLPGIFAGLAGLTLGFLLLFLTRRKGASESPGAELLDLEQKVQLLVEQLRALEADRHQLAEETYLAERSRLETETATALRARDAHVQAHATLSAQGNAEAAAPHPSQPGFFDRNPQLKGALWGAGVVLFFVLVGYMATRAERVRGPTDEMTGANPNLEANGSAPPREPPRLEDDPVFQQAWERAKRHPQDAAASAFVAHDLIRAQRFDEAEVLTKKALAADPFHLESRIHLEVLKATQGELRPALDRLENLARTWPDAHEALLFRGALALELGESRVALDSFERFAALAPKEEQPPQLEQTIRMLRQRVPGP